jgi:predicted nucleic acid-binding protein
MTYLLDTDVFVDFFKHTPYATALIEKLSQDTLALSALTITELRSGWSAKEATYLLPRLYALCTVVPVTREIAEQAGAWRKEYKGKGISLGTPDTVIAATAYLNHATLLTNNIKDYPMPELALQAPAKVPLPEA